MKIAYISTYPPKQCGIATFTQDLKNAIADNENIVQHIFAIADDNDDHPNDSEVVFIIKRNHIEDYYDAAQFINQQAYDFVIIEHEFGIFGGNSGMYILAFAKSLTTRLLVSFHTVLERSSNDENAIFIELAHLAQRIIVMSQFAISMMEKIYHISPEKVVCIPHGVPEFTLTHQQAKENLHLTNKKIILTFGFIGRNKGIELVIKALPHVVKKHPDVLYIVAGKTHPNVLLHSGEEYRDYLEELVEKYQLSEHVHFLNQYLPIDTLTNLLSACDVYITPYINEAQITSGTLSYAIGAGAAVISTPYWHAKDLLSEERGILIPFKDRTYLADCLNHLFDEEEILSNYRAHAKAYGDQITWKKIGLKYLNLFHELKKTDATPEAIIDEKFSEANYPTFNFEHINRLTNHVGILQHAKYATPNYFEGYCLDDNARALLLDLMAYRQYQFDIKELHLSTYLAYLFYAQNEDGTFKNFMNFQHQFIDQEFSEDAFGRAIWALGQFFQLSPIISHYEMAKEMFFKALPHFIPLKSNRAIAYTILGICAYLETNQNDENMTELLRQMVQKLIAEYEAHQTENWDWYEHIISYDNAILPYSILLAHQYLNDNYFKRVGIKTAEFLDQIVFKGNYLRLIGNKNWYKKGEEPCHIGQQPIDAASMVLLYETLYKVTEQKNYLTKMKMAFEWFLGRNELQMPLYDDNTKGCCDGLEQFGINRNQGAESTLSFWIAYLTVIKHIHKEDE